MADEIISVDDVEVQPRGRRKVIDEALAAQLKKLRPNQAIALSDTFGSVAPDQRATTSQVIRKHWNHVRSDKCRIDYSKTGVPQVRVKAEKADA